MQAASILELCKNYIYLVLFLIVPYFIPYKRELFKHAHPFLTQHIDLTKPYREVQRFGIDGEDGKNGVNGKNGIDGINEKNELIQLIWPYIINSQPGPAPSCPECLPPNDISDELKAITREIQKVPKHVDTLLFGVDFINHMLHIREIEAREIDSTYVGKPKRVLTKK